MQSEAIKRIHLGAPFGEHLSREAIKKPSEAIRGHSEAIRGHQRASEGIRGQHLVARGEDPRRQDRIGIAHHHRPLIHIWVGRGRGDCY